MFRFYLVLFKPMKTKDLRHIVTYLYSFCCCLFFLSKIFVMFGLMFLSCFCKHFKAWQWLIVLKLQKYNFQVNICRAAKIVAPAVFCSFYVLFKIVCKYKQQKRKVNLLLLLVIVTKTTIIYFIQLRYWVVLVVFVFCPSVCLCC